MILKSFGCSFIFGIDLADAVRNSFYIHGSYLTWPALLAKDQGHDYQCYAIPGSGNLQITEQILNQVSKSEPCIFVIGWTWIDRFDYNNRDDDSWKTIMPVNTDPVAKTYYRDIHSQYRDKFTTLLNIKLVIDTLKQNSIPFIMTYMDDLIFETEWHTTPAIIELQNYIRPYMTNFEGSTFLDWTKEKGFSISETLHPLEEAHQAAFKLIKSYNLV